ncbi:hypothetical protein FSP39_006432 [Pinctada imbricata]|uniref:Centriolar satellite-associated tubulin polyglutamylase complex regulator 1 n=1 Tax=Pinctada imbricata TaxID=66713 RepID=A0AA88YQ49_PINIB|nr:hypothetical protein FSP39_006432 [Pinctada imbricata]
MYAETPLYKNECLYLETLPLKKVYLIYFKQKKAKHHVLVYLEDSIAQLLEHREENPKINGVKFLGEYFNSLRDGNHTMFREFSFVHATPHNRASFVRLFWKCYRQIGKKGDLLSIQEYHSLLSLICPDFPFETVQKTARIILMDDALDCLISFSDFIYAFQVQFYFEEFMEKCYEMYHSLMQTQRSPRDPVVVPSGKDDSGIHQNSHHPADGVDAMQYFRAIYPLCDRSSFSTPPVNSLKEILFNIPRVSFYGFLMALAKSESINEYLGRLPTKSELLEGADAELTSPSIRASSKAKIVRPVSASGSGESQQNVYTTQQVAPPGVTSGSTGMRPPSSAARRPPVPSKSGSNSTTNTGKTAKGKQRKKDSSDESSSDDDTDDTSDDDTV